MKKQTKAIIAMALLAFMIPLMFVPSSANSALTQWGGKDVNGVVTTDEDCPIVVEHEKLVFDINNLPTPDEAFSTVIDNSTVTAEYTFYNPSDMTVSAKLAFPFGIINGDYYEGEINKHNITVNGEKIDAEIRHTLYTSNSFGEYKFSVDEDLPRLLDDYVADDFFNEETAITKYSAYLQTTGESAYNWVFDINPEKYPNTVFYVPSASYTTKLENGDLRITGIINGTFEKVEIYVFGETTGVTDLSFKFYKHSWTFDGEKRGGEEVDGYEKFSISPKMSFTDFIFEYYEEESGISRMDWYNATLLRLQNVNVEYRYLYFARFEKDYHKRFMCWYYYDITLDPGERIVNSVTAPMNPEININYEPAKYNYTYLISPAATWADFGKLDIYINTPYYLVYNNIKGFEKTDNGYELHLDGLPRERDRYRLTLNGIVKEQGKVKDLTFTLSEAEDPEIRNKLTPGERILIILGIIVAIIFLPVILVVGIIYVIAQGISRLIRKSSGK